MVRTLRLKVRRDSYRWLNAAASEVNSCWNFCNEHSSSVFGNLGKRLTGFDLCAMTTGSEAYMNRIGADTIQRVCIEYAAKKLAARKQRLRWRVSRGTRRSLGWVPFKAKNLKRKGSALRFAGKTFRVFNAARLIEAKWKQGCFAQDAVGDWWLCLPVEAEAEQSVAPLESVGIDLGLKAIATTSDGDVLEAGRWTHGIADRLATAQRRGHRRQAKRLHRKASRRRADALHKFSRKIVDKYQKIVVGDVSSPKLVKTRMAKSVLDSGWGMLRNMLDYKSQQAARTFSVVNERYTSRACSGCGALTGPAGLDMLSVRQWECVECGDIHDRDINAAKNILTAGSRCGPPSCGNELRSMSIESRG